ncbi:Sugar transferase involved in LPS biosynthesis (colanic, teichoic acid) [Onishia taeanensis]|jgi:lipopolysaccharide/colanic/teichoic acid biosynthesis glycosyltransferase|uniref:Sugar transferase involved in LPS biosynthesis (Colanic, teichoic acid) n=1 Tax=Onishia taeanensis TaxID=284577 RepID=A0A1G7Q4G6_9GAMM|nr:sugar transferase [Halomonas taeanensis]SDF93355.1 Sugar transferase involved in LPS biosynthesis (colanic, teichoic acid) [Halomonas taeanensis]
MAKRLFDVSVALALLVVLSPLITIVAMLIAFRLGRPVFFRQSRPGLHGRPYEIVKFRTMRDAVDSQGRPLPDEARMTRLGTWLRATSIDELPELWNVVKGEMSLVGPRPLMMEYLPRYSVEQQRRHEVLPGITGWAQVNGRNSLSWQEKFELDVWYVDHRTAWLDLRILMLTVKKVFCRDGISAEGHVTVEDFYGND